MKRIRILAVLAISLVVTTLNSCKKKEAVTPSATITANVDGTATVFNTNAKAMKATVEGVTVTTIQGQAANGAVISISLLGTVTAGKTYSAASNNPDDEPLLALTTSTEQFLNDDNSSNLVSVTINSVSSSSVQGTFKGDLVSTNISVGNTNTTPATKAITNGAFNVSF